MFYLGVDGGGTGCRARLEDASGRLISQSQSGPANIATDREAALASIMQAAQTACAGHCDLGDVVAGLGLAGASLTEPRDWIAARLPFKSARIAQDVETSLIGALGESDGILAAIGTGSVFASQRGGEIRVIGGWGLRLGDEGSGAWIGRELCRRAMGAAEGFVPQTPILTQVLDRIGGPQAMVAFGGRAAPADFAALAPDVITGASLGDPAGVAVLDAAVSHVRAAILILQSEGTVPITFLGGLGSIFVDLLNDEFKIFAPKGNALDGAMALAHRGMT